MALVLFTIIVLVVIGVILFLTMSYIAPHLSYLFDKKDIKMKYRTMGYEMNLEEYKLKKETENSIKLIDSLIDSIDNEERLAELRELRKSYELLIEKIQNGEVTEDHKERGE